MKYLKRYNQIKENQYLDPIQWSEIMKTCRELKQDQSINLYSINEDGTVDIDGGVYLSSKYLHQLPLRFGKVTGDFYCRRNLLKTLEGAPMEANNFYCNLNQLTSLEGSPQLVIGEFDCSGNQLTSLKGGPKEIGSNFYCSGNKLTSLEGIPEGVTFLNCSSNKITHLGRLPETLKYIICNNNQLTSLEGSPEIVSTLQCDQNQLTSLKGGPKKVHGEFNCSKNKLTSLVGGPESVGGDYNCSKNELTNLVGSPKKFDAFYCNDNPKLRSLFGGPETDFIHLSGCPVEVIYDFFFRYSTNGISKAQEFMIKINHIYTDLWLGDGTVIQGDILEEIADELGITLPTDWQDSVEEAGYKII